MRLRSYYIILFVIIIIAWQYFGSTNNLVKLLVSNPTDIISYFKDNWQDLLQATGVTFMEAILGLIIATSFSFIIMIICFYFPNFFDFIMPIMVTSQIIPLIVLAPFFILLFGIGYTSKIAMAALISFFPVFVNFATGVKSIPQAINEFSYINNTKTWTKIKNIYFPLSYVNIFTGLRVAATLSVIGAIVAEFTGAKIGLGKNLFISSIRIEPELMMSSLFLSTIVGFFIFSLVIFFEKKLFYKL